MTDHSGWSRRFTHPTALVYAHRGVTLAWSSWRRHDGHRRRGRFGGGVQERVNSSRVKNRLPVDTNLLAAAVTSIVAASAGFVLPEGNPIRIACSLLLVLVLPGYVFTAVLFPDALHRPSERILMTVGLSLAVVVLLGIALNVAPGGLRQHSWALALSSFTMVMAAVGTIRRPARLRAPASLAPRASRITLGQALLFGLAGLILLGAFSLATYGARRDADQTTFTQMWLLPAEGDTNRSVLVGIRNQETDAQVYTLTMTLDGQLLSSWPVIALAKDETWETVVTLPAGRGFISPVRAELQRVQAPETVYRSVVLWPTASGR